METSHVKQTNDAIAQSLTAAGIGSTYHRRKLSEVANGGFFTQWVLEHARGQIKEGRGMTIVGDGLQARDAFILLARGVHLSGFKARVVPLRRLITQIIRDGDMLEQYEDCKALFVSNFFQVYPGNPTPLNGREIQEVEEFLSDRLEQRKSVFIHTARPLTEADVWWSKKFVHFLQGFNRCVEVAE